MKCDCSSQIIEDVKWFMFENGEHEVVANELGGLHGLKFVSWCGDGHSFIVTDGEEEYRLTITKEENV
jgi:hypothetical protein